MYYSSPLGDEATVLQNLVVKQIEILLEKGMLLFHCLTKILAYFHKIKSEL
jgi:hypothetical protein